MVTHHLAQAQKCDKIAVLVAGELVEVGNHDQLMALKGVYYELYQTQQSTEEKEHGNDITDYGSVKKPGDSQGDGRAIKIVSVEDEKNDKTVEKSPSLSLFKRISLLAEDWHWLLLGIVASLAMGAIIPGGSFLLGEYFRIFETHATDGPEMMRRARIYALSFLGVAGAALIASFLSTVMYGLVIERLIFRLRCAHFRSLLRHDMGWFDESQNSPPELVARITGDTGNLQQLTGWKVALMGNGIVMLFGAVIFSLVLTWRLGLVVAAAIPVVLHSAAVAQRATDDARDASVKRIVEFLSAFKTVTSLHVQYYFRAAVKAAEENRSRFQHRTALRTAFVAAYSRSTFLTAHGVAFFVSAYWVGEQILHPFAFFKVIDAVLFSLVVVNESGVFAGDVKTGWSAIAKFVFDVQNDHPDWSDKADQNVEPTAVVSHGQRRFAAGIELNNVHFRYPSRRDAVILNGLTIKIQPGESVALIGPSGGGKSSVFQILQKFYPTDAGSVTVDGVDIRKLDEHELRSRIALVSQEPRLFSTTIYENITYGLDDRQVTADEVVWAARAAQAHEFIKQLPNGYDTDVGASGGKLSGGQKQRIAIARAILRRPDILLLDEATAALDPESEHLVQMALQSAMNGRTCLTIAHRAAALRGVDRIYMIKDGTAVESVSDYNSRV